MRTLLFVIMFLAIFLTQAAYAGNLDVMIDVSSINGQSVDLAFDFTDGDNAVNNVIRITDFSTDGSYDPNNSSIMGDVGGALAGTVTLGDNSFFSEFLQPLTLQSYIHFRLGYSNNYNASYPVPDEFSFFLLDHASGMPLFSTTDPVGADSLFSLDLTGGSTGMLTVFQSTAAGQTPSWSVNEIPEPPMLSLWGIGAFVFWLRRRFPSKSTRHCRIADLLRTVFGHVRYISRPSVNINPGALLKEGGVSHIFFLLFIAWAAIGWSRPLHAADNMVDVSNKVQVSFSGLRFNRSTNTYDTLATLTNTSSDKILPSMALAVANITPATVSLANSTGQLTGGIPYVGIPLSSGQFDPGQSITTVLRFNNPSRVAFTYTPTVHGVVNQTPRISSQPIIDASVNTLYQYQVIATDPDGDPLSYSLLSQAPGMAINSGSGLIQWTPLAAGDFPVTVQVADGKGGQATQSFTVSSSSVNILTKISDAGFGWTKCATIPSSAVTEYHYQSHAGTVYDELNRTILIFGAETHGASFDNAWYSLNVDTLHFRRLYAPDPYPGDYRMDGQGIGWADINHTRPWGMHSYQEMVYIPSEGKVYVMYNEYWHAYAQYYQEVPGVSGSVNLWTFDPVTLLWDHFEGTGVTAFMNANAGNTFAKAVIYDPDTNAFYSTSYHGVIKLQKDNWNGTVPTISNGSEPNTNIHDYGYKVYDSNGNGKLVWVGGNDPTLGLYSTTDIKTGATTKKILADFPVLSGWTTANTASTALPDNTIVLVAKDTATGSKLRAFIIDPINNTVTDTGYEAVVGTNIAAAGVYLFKAQYVPHLNASVFIFQNGANVEVWALKLP